MGAILINFPEKTLRAGKRYSENISKILEIYMSVRGTTQNDVSIRFLLESVEERINTSINVSENTMEYFLKNVKYVIVF